MCRSPFSVEWEGAQIKDSGGGLDSSSEGYSSFIANAHEAAWKAKNILIDNLSH